MISAPNKTSIISVAALCFQIIRTPAYNELFGAALDNILIGRSEEICDRLAAKAWKTFFFQEQGEYED